MDEMARFYTMQTKSICDIINQEYQFFLKNCNTSTAKGLSGMSMRQAVTASYMTVGKLVVFITLLSLRTVSLMIDL